MLIRNHAKKINPIDVFVYGTLRKGQGNHQFLEKAEFRGRTRISGTMYNLGPFPAVANTKEGVIHGEVYRVSEEQLANLDALEGNPDYYHRHRVNCSLGKVWAYFMPHPRLKEQHYPVIESGDWLKHVEDNK